MGRCRDEKKCALSNHLNNHATVDLYVSYVGRAHRLETSSAGGQLVVGNTLNRELHRAVFHRTLAWIPTAVHVSSFRPEHRVLLNVAGQSLTVDTADKLVCRHWNDLDYLGYADVTTLWCRNHLARRMC
jgi:hypothetical protein